MRKIRPAASWTERIVSLRTMVAFSVMQKRMLMRTWGETILQNALTMD
jgi:hypothetical protein